MRRRAIALLLLVAAGMLALLLLEVEKGRAREPVPRRAVAPEARASELVCAAPEEEAVTAAKTVALSGTVRDERGRPIPGARVRLFKDRAAREANTWRDDAPDAGDPAHEVTADAHGGFAVTVTNGTPWTLVADAPEFLPAVVPVPRGIESADFPITLARGATYRLRAVDIDGKPLPDAEALVFHKGETLRTSVHADAGGWIEARLAPLELLLVRAPGYSWELAEPPLDGPEVVLDREYRLGGVVVTGDGSPAAGVRLSFERYLWIDHVMTGGDGSFLIDGLGEEEVKLMVAPPDREWRWETVQPGDERLRIVVPTARVSGVVLLPDGSPAAGATVDCGNGGSVCDDNGGFAIDDALLPGDTEFKASIQAPRTRLEGHTRVAVGGEDVTGVRIALVAAPLSFVRVSVVGPDGAPVEADVRSQGERWCPSEWRPDAPGRGILEVDDVPGAEVLLSSVERNPGPGAPRLSGTARAVTGASCEGPAVTMRLQPPLVVTVVCREADGSVLPADVETRVSIRGLWAAQLTPDGPGRHRFRVLAGETESGTIVVHAAGYAPVSLPALSPPIAGGEFEIRLHPAIRIVGHVFDPDASAADKLLVDFVGESSSNLFDPSGHFSFDSVAGARVAVVARKGPVPGSVRGFDVPAKGPVDLGDIRLEKPWVLRGAVAAEGGAPAGGVTVTVRGPGYEGKTTSYGDGTFRLDAPPSDLFTVVAEKGRLKSEPVPASTFLRESQPLRLH